MKPFSIMDQKPWAGLGGTTSTAVKKIKLTVNNSDVFMSTNWRQLKGIKTQRYFNIGF